MAKILLVEDDPLMIRMYQRKLLNDGFEVDIAVNGEEGLVKVRSVNPDLMLLDRMMRKLNGLQVLERMKADPVLAKIPVIILTNLGGSQEDIEHGLELGAVAYLVKSAYRPDQVLSKVKEILAGYTRSKEVPQASTSEAAQKVKEATSAGVQPPAPQKSPQPQSVQPEKSTDSNIVKQLKELLASQMVSDSTFPPQIQPESQKSVDSDVVAQLKQLLAAQAAASGAPAPIPASTPNTTQLSDEELLEAFKSLLKKHKG